MALTKDEIANIRAIMAQIWDASVLGNIRMNDDVVEVVEAAYKSAMQKSVVLYEMAQKVVEAAQTGISISGYIGKGILARTFGHSMTLLWPELTKPFKAVLATVAAQYRTPLMMASNGLGVWI